jgi:hypothetical protein
MEAIATSPQTKNSDLTFILPLEPAATAAASTEKVLEPNCESSRERSGYFCQVQAAEKLAGFDARELPFDPKGMKFSKVNVLPGNTASITMEFVVIDGGGYLYLHQGIDDFPPGTSKSWQAGRGWSPKCDLSRVGAGGCFACAGGGERWFSPRNGNPYPIEWLDGEIVKLAESLVDERPADAEKALDPEYLPSAEVAGTGGLRCTAPDLTTGVRARERYGQMGWCA